MNTNEWDDLVLLIAIAILAVIVSLTIIVLPLVLVGKAAKKRGRSVAGWVIFAIFFNWLAWIVLLVLGETDERRRQRIIEEEELRQGIARRYAQDAPYRQYERPEYLGKNLNDLYSDHKRYLPK